MLIKFEKGATIWQPSRNPAYPPSAPVTPMQPSVRSASGKIYSQDLGQTQTVFHLLWPRLPDADFDGAFGLWNFISVTVGFKTSEFTYYDKDGATYTCVFNNAAFDFPPTSALARMVELKLEVVF